MMYADGYGLSRSELYSAPLTDFHLGWRRTDGVVSEAIEMMLTFGIHINNILVIAVTARP